MYTKEWYKQISEWSLESAKNTLGYLFNCLGFIPKSVIDIGGGAGAFASAFYDAGIKDVTVLDGEWVKEATRYLPDSCFIYHNLENNYNPTRKYDLALCCEVAEHIPADYAGTLLDTVVACSDVCLWSAALPGQGGNNHINEQPEEYWEELFLQRQRIKFDILRNQLQHEPDNRIKSWYKQNYLIYAK